MPLPDVSEAFWDLTMPIQLRIVGKATEDFEVVEKFAAPITFQGIFEPLDATRLLVKPEGQRSWKWWSLFTTQPLTLDWIIQDMSSVKFRVMQKTDWNSGGYLQYELRENPVAD